ncbi:hypothetical protein [Burkholderia latens]|uniref:hypothetical protein n=1 Tax=Burkholderia latens TaxID=488446 RepID=UPI00158B079F|nr:hypothetical protein [Burkholderia latens]
MSNLAGMMPRLFAIPARLPMDNCPGIRWASSAAHAGPLRTHPNRGRHERLCYETSGARIAAFRRAAMSAALAMQDRAGARRTGTRHRRPSRAVPRRPFRNGNTRAVSTRRYVTSLKHFIVRGLPRGRS